jgi:hypothetical protein
MPHSAFNELKVHEHKKINENKNYFERFIELGVHFAKRKNELK